MFVRSFLFTLLALGTAAAQDRPGSTWASIAQLPNFTGVWEVARGGGGAGRGGRGAAPAKPDPIVLTARYDALLQAYRANPPQDSAAANCVPPGMPSIMTQPYPIEFTFGPGKVTILIEAYMQVRHIYTDGRPHPEDPDLTFNGHSIGRWEGEVLVVDTVGFTPDTTLGGGTHHSDKMHIVERIRLVNPDLMEIVTTVEDPEALQKPYMRTSTFARHADWTLAEYICQQNNRNFVTEDGKAGIDLSR